MPSGMIKHPEDISGTLSKLKWPLHGSSFWEIVQKLKGVMDSGPKTVEGDSATLWSVTYLVFTQSSSCL